MNQSLNTTVDKQDFLNGEVCIVQYEGSEIPKEYFDSFMKNESLIRTIKQLGFPYLTLDLEGFRSGSMDL